MKPGDVPACVWPAYNEQIRLQFELRMVCRESECAWDPQHWHLFRQIASLKVAQVLGVPLSEVHSAGLYWLVSEEAADATTPKLQKFLVARQGESDFPGRRLEEPSFAVRLAFRADTKRIRPGSSKAIHLLEQNDTEKIFQYIGLRASVHNLRHTAVPSDVRFPQDAFKPVFRFEGFGPNVKPGGSLELGGVAPLMRQEECSDGCYVHSELAAKGKCETDCDCNGKRWCNHLGECTGKFLPCGVERAETSTRMSPVAQLSDSCSNVVESTWNKCYIGIISEADCNWVACGVLITASQTTGCKADVCGGRLGFWEARCPASDNARAVFVEARGYTCSGVRSQPTTTTRLILNNAQEQRAEERNVVSLLAALFAGASLCCCTVCFVTSLRDYGSDHPICLHLHKCTSFVSARVAPLRPGAPSRPGSKAKLDRRATMRIPQQDEHLSPSKRWLAILHRWTGLGQPPEPPPPPEPTPKLKRQRSMRKSGTADSSRQAWSESRSGSKEAADSRQAWSEARSGSKCSAEGGARVAPEIPPAVASPQTEEERALGSELRTLRNPEHSAEDRKKFYQKQCLRWHPDKNIGNEEQAGEMFKVLQESKTWFFNED